MTGRRAGPVPQRLRRTMITYWLLPAVALAPGMVVLAARRGPFECLAHRLVRSEIDRDHRRSAPDDVRQPYPGLGKAPYHI